MDDHGNDVAAAGGSTGLENQADGNAIDHAAHHGIEEIVGDEEKIAVRNLHIVVHRFFYDALVNHGIITPCRLQHPCKGENQYSGNHRFDTEFRSENPGADKQKRNIHTDGIVADLPWPHRIEHIGKAVSASRREQIGVHKHHIADGKEQTAQYQQQICHQFILYLILFLHVISF